MGGTTRARLHATASNWRDSPYSDRFSPHLAVAAFRAISLRCSAVSDSARRLPPTLPPLRPKATAAGFLRRRGFGDRVASCTTRNAVSFTSWPRRALLERLGMTQGKYSPQTTTAPNREAGRLLRDMECAALPVELQPQGNTLPQWSWRASNPQPPHFSAGVTIQLDPLHPARKLVGWR